MSDTKRFTLAHAEARRRAIEAIQQAPDGYRVEVKPAKRKDIQSDKFHAMIDDIAKQTEYAGKRWDAADMKRILVDEFADELRLAGSPLHHDSRVVPSENGRRVIQLGCQTAEFLVREAADFITFLYAWGDARSVKWSEPCPV